MAIGHDDAPRSSSTDAHRSGSSSATGSGDPGVDIESLIDIESLRGWSEYRDPALRAPHRLPALAELVELDDDGRRAETYSVHGTDILVGRSHFRHPPVDLFPHRLRDHQLYRLGTPHVRLFLSDGQWHLRVLTPRCPTAIEGRAIHREDPPRPLQAGEHLTLGVTTFRFDPRHDDDDDESIDEWRRRRDELLANLRAPTLLLERFGSPCGPLYLLQRRTPLILGRTHPGPDVFPDTSHWPEPDDHFWDLSGVFDHERSYLAFRHAAVERRQRRWTLRAISSSHRTFLNGTTLSGSERLETGDRIGLGSLVLRFHDPQRPRRRPRPSPIPEVVDWSEGPVLTPSSPEPE